MTPACVAGFPPHARGWTVGPMRRLWPSRVSPARAGMDPGGPARHSRRDRFPRTRGDGPSTNGPIQRGSAFPPHARGWTRHVGLRHHGDAVSPARAGMDRARRRQNRRLTSFPRTRGDGPDSTTCPFSRNWFPPHARGWTCHPCPRRHSGQVSPARAGMDRTEQSPQSPAPGFPRTRGDGPAFSESSGWRPSFPPHARGWTLHWDPGSANRGVSPARAGMDPPRPEPLPPAVGFPRTRGDGPPTRRSSSPSPPFPPHARGWTPEHRPQPVVFGVSPARAGMDRTIIGHSHTAGSFPRTRGDGPVSLRPVEGGCQATSKTGPLGDR